MATKGNVDHQIKSDAIEALALYCNSYLSLMTEDGQTVRKAATYLTDPENIDGSATLEFREHIVQIEPAVDTIIGKFTSYQALAQKMVEVFNTESARRKKSFGEAKEEATKAALKLKNVGRK